MTSNRIAKSNLIKKLVEVKKAAKYPVKPSYDPAVLYVQDVLNPENLTWDKPQRRSHNLNETVRRAKSAWPKMNPLIKGNYQYHLYLASWSTWVAYYSEGV